MQLYVDFYESCLEALLHVYYCPIIDSGTDFLQHEVEESTGRQIAQRLVHVFGRVFLKR